MEKTLDEPTRLHLALNTERFEQSVEFYRALFDTQPSKIKPGYAKFEVESPPLNLTLNEAQRATGNQINHLGIEVKAKGDVQKQNDRLKKLGLKTYFEESNICCYSLQDKVWAEDPDGNSWETFVVLEDTDEKVGEAHESSYCSQEDGAESSCCIKK